MENISRTIFDKLEKDLCENGQSTFIVSVVLVQFKYLKICRLCKLNGLI